MNLSEMIYRRKSVRKYKDTPVDPQTMNELLDFISGVRPLYPDIRVQAEILPKQQIRCFLPWVTPQVLAIFSRIQEGCFENVGFMFQQVDLYLQSKGLGSCWLGMGRLRKTDAFCMRDNMEFVIMIGFGYPNERSQRASVSEFRRKTLGEISDYEDFRLEPARLAPSGVNSQPWYFVHEEDTIHVYCVTHGLLKDKKPTNMNRLDVGIAMAHLYMSYPERFEFFRVYAPPQKGYSYIGSISI